MFFKFACSLSTVAIYKFIALVFLKLFVILIHSSIVIINYSRFTNFKVDTSIKFDLTVTLIKLSFVMYQKNICWSPNFD